MNSKQTNERGNEKKMESEQEVLKWKKYDKT